MSAEARTAVRQLRSAALHAIRLHDVVCLRHTLHMPRSDAGLLVEIENDLLDSKPLSDVLRKCLILGGRANSAELKDWATRELKGYGDAEELPPYRIVPATLRADAFVGHTHVQGQPISTQILPEFARENIHEKVYFRSGLAELSALAERADSVNILPVMASDLVAYMNSQDEDSDQRFISIYWTLSPVVVLGVVDAVRTTLAELIAELRATVPDGQESPTKDQATHAIQLVVNGKKSNVGVTANQASGGSTAIISSAPAADASWWTRQRKIGAFIVGFATIVGSGAAVVQIYK